MEFLNRSRELTVTVSRSAKPAPAEGRVTFVAKKSLAAYAKSEVSLEDARLLNWAREPARAKGDVHSKRVAFSEGGFASIMAIDTGVDAFKLHTNLRALLNTDCAGGPDAVDSITVDVSRLDAALANRVLEGVVELAGLAAWRPEAFGLRMKDAKPVKGIELKVISKLTPKAVAALATRGQALAEANNLVRTLAKLPKNQLMPATYRKVVETYAKSRKATMEFWDTKVLTKKNAGAFLAVVRADADTASGIARLVFKSKLKKPKKVVTLVGKGLCYDTGGYNIKTGGYMAGMHEDMAGSAVALATGALVSKLHPEFEVRVFMAIAENLISPSAYTPDEVVITANGTSIEVVDTDAEGRMVLSDTLVFASQEKPDVVIDYATLTGAAVRAIDTRRSAMFSNQPKTMMAAHVAGETSGERVWGFPIGDDFEEGLESKVADTLQCSHSKNSDHIYAATFLSKFIEKDVPWVHIDLSSHANKGGLGLVNTEVTGFGPRWTLTFVESLR